jgi:CxxC-x17-CxxC domain-containing protein
MSEKLVKFKDRVLKKSGSRSGSRSGPKRDFRKSGGRDSGRSSGRDSGRSSGRDSRRSSGRDSGRDFKRSSGRDSGRSNRGETKLEWTKVICDACKSECEVPFKPTSDKPIFCDKCFNKNSKANATNKDLEEINIKLDKIMKSLKIK